MAEFFTQIINEDLLSEFIDSISNFSEPLLLLLHNIKSKYLGSIKIIVKLLVHFVSLIKVGIYWYMIYSFENKKVDLNETLDLKNYPIINSVWPTIQNNFSNNLTISRDFIAECRNLTLEKSLPHYFISKSLSVYTIAQVTTFLIGIYELFKLMTYDEITDKIEKKND